MPEDIFDKAAKSAPKGDIFDQAASPEIPDVVAQARKVISSIPQHEKSPSEEVFKPQSGPSAGARGGYFLPSYESAEEARGGAKQASIGLGTMGGGALSSGMGLVGRMAVTGAGAATGDVAGDVAGGQKPSGKEALGVGATTAAGVGVGSGISKIAKMISPKVAPTQKINELLGVTQKEIKVGSTPESLSDFAQNPARGVIKSGLDEKALAKMNPLERNIAVTKARNEVGKQLEQVLKNASQSGEKALPEKAGMKAGKSVDFQKVMDSVFDKGVIPDKALAKQTANRLQQILTKTKLNGKLLSELTPHEAWTLRQELDEFADFAPEGTAKTFRQVATQLRRGISDAIHKAVSESTALDQHYSDLAGATKAARRQAAEFAKSTPESKLRKWIVKAAVKTGTGLSVPGL